MADIALWNGDICDLEVDAIVSPAGTGLPQVSRVTFALRGAAPYEAFRSALAGPLGTPARTLA